MPEPIALALGATAASCAAYVVLWTAFARGLRRSPRAPGSGEAPVVSILKPLSGLDDDLEDNLASFAAIDYPRFELLVPAAATLQALLAAGALQIAGAFASLWIVRRARPAWWFLLLEPVRTALLAGCWLAGWLGRRVCWRGHPYLLGPGSVLTPA